MSCLNLCQALRPRALDLWFKSHRPECTSETARSLFSASRSSRGRVAVPPPSLPLPPSIPIYPLEALAPTDCRGRGRWPHRRTFTEFRCVSGGFGPSASAAPGRPSFPRFAGRDRWTGTAARACPSVRSKSPALGLATWPSPSQAAAWPRWLRFSDHLLITTWIICLVPAASTCAAAHLYCSR